MAPRRPANVASDVACVFKPRHRRASESCGPRGGGVKKGLTLAQTVVLRRRCPWPIAQSHQFRGWTHAREVTRDTVNELPIGGGEAPVARPTGAGRSPVAGEDSTDRWPHAREWSDTTEGRPVFYTLIFGGLALLIIVGVLIQKARTK